MSAPVGISVTERTEGTRRVLEADGWEWVTAEEFGDDEPRISDEALAPRLGMEVRRMRELSERHEQAGNVSPRVCRTVRQTGGRPGNQRWYTEADALFLVTRSEKAEAIALTKAMIQVVIAVRRHLLSTVAVVAHSRRPPSPRLPPVPEDRQLPARVPPGTLGDLADWPEVVRYVRDDARQYPAWVFEALALWPVPPHLNISPAAIRDLARVALGHTVLASLRGRA